MTARGFAPILGATLKDVFAGIPPATPPARSLGLNHGLAVDLCHAPVA